MEVQVSTLKNISIGIVVVVILVGLFIVLGNSTDKGEPKTIDIPEPLTLNGDEQILNLTAKGGYSPSVITAEAGKETILVVNTKNTFDCSSAFVIPELDIQSNLPVTGATQFRLGTFESGKELFGSCSMGMYTFKIKFT